MKYIEPEQGIYRFGKELYLITKDEEGKLRTANPDGVIEASPCLFRFEEPLTKNELQELHLRYALFQDSGEYRLIERGLEILAKQSSSQTKPKFTEHRSQKTAERIKEQFKKDVSKDPHFGTGLLPDDDW